MTLDPAQLDDYQRDGFVAVPGFLSPQQTDYLDAWVAQLDEEPGRSSGRWYNHYELIEGGRTLTRTERFLHADETVRELLEGAMAELSGACFGEPARVFKEKLNYKLPGGAGYAAHQDAPAFPIGSRHLTCMIALDDATPVNGGLELVAGRHREGLLPQDDAGCIAPAAEAEMQWVAAPCLRGGALLFDSFTPHRSEPNRSEIARRILYITYAPAADGDLRDAYYELKSKTLQQGRVSLIGHFQGKVDA